MSNYPTPKYTATMTLPKGGVQAWTNVMQGKTPPTVPDQIDTGSPVVMARAIFEDGTWVAGGVYKGPDPTDYNIKFMGVFDSKGNQYPGWPIDTSDEEDFSRSQYYFSITDASETVYLLKIVEAES